MLRTKIDSVRILLPSFLCINSTYLHAHPIKIIQKGMCPPFSNLKQIGLYGGELFQSQGIEFSYFL